MYVIMKTMLIGGKRKNFYYAKGPAAYCTDINEARKFRKTDVAEKTVIELGKAEFKHQKESGFDVRLDKCIEKAVKEHIIMPI